jgi:hypothetical protein
LNATPERSFATPDLRFATREASHVAIQGSAPPPESRFATPAPAFATSILAGVAYFSSRAASHPVAVVPFGSRITPEPMEEAAMATEPMTLQEIIVSLEAQAAHHREQLEQINRRLEELRTAVSAASDLAEGARTRLVAPDARLDIGTPAKPNLARMVRQSLTEVAPDRPFGPNWVTQEVNRRFGPRLKNPVDVRQISAVLRRMERLGELRRHKSGGARHESEYVRGTAPG